MVSCVLLRRCETKLIKSRVENLELPAIHPKMAFIHGALDKEIRLSFAQRIKGTLPEPYIHLITEGKEKDTPEFKYLSESKSTPASPRQVEIDHIANITQ